MSNRLSLRDSSSRGVRDRRANTKRINTVQSAALAVDFVDLGDGVREYGLGWAEVDRERIDNV